MYYTLMKWEADFHIVLLTTQPHSHLRAFVLAMLCLERDYLLFRLMLRCHFISEIFLHHSVYKAAQLHIQIDPKALTAHPQHFFLSPYPYWCPQVKGRKETP